MRADMSLDENISACSTAPIRSPRNPDTPVSAPAKLIVPMSKEQFARNTTGIPRDVDTATVSTQSCTGPQAQQLALATASPQSQALSAISHPNSMPQPTHMDARGATLTSVGRDQVYNYENSC